MSDEIVPMILSLCFLALGISFFVITSRKVWPAFDALTLRANPIRRALQQKLPRFDAIGLVVARWALRFIGLVFVISGVIGIIGQIA